MNKIDKMIKNARQHWGFVNPVHLINPVETGFSGVEWSDYGRTRSCTYASEDVSRIAKPRISTLVAPADIVHLRWTEKELIVASSVKGFHCRTDL